VQLKRPGTRVQLMTASCALLSAAARAQTAVDSSLPLQTDSSVLYYKESAGRVQAIEPVVNLKYDFGDQRVLAGTFVADVLSGATPNGALPARTPQTFASPSSRSLVPTPGRKTTLYTVAPGNLPQDPHFDEQRFAGDVDWSQPHGLDDMLSAGMHVSAEHDFDSVQAQIGASHDFNSKNTTISAALNQEYDRIDPNGGTPVPGSQYVLYQHESSQSKNVTGAMFGLTQVLTSNWLTGLNYTADLSRGYLTDPYRLLSVLDDAGAVTAYRYENRPDSRTRQSLYWVNRAALGTSVLDVSYRRGRDNWGITSDTVEGHLHITLGSTTFVEPHLRWYRQGTADFYRLYLDSAAQPTYMSADPRLAAFVATTYGLKFGATFGRIGEVGLRIERYVQRPHAQLSPLPELRGLDLNPDLKATIAQLTWRYQF
jgi:hypothetical protein